MNAQEKIKTLLDEIGGLFAEAERLADEAGEQFYWDGPTYGMGGSYVPKSVADRENEETREWLEKTGRKYGYHEKREAGWQASSHSC